MRTRKSSLLASLVLALSLALSPVSAFAEELDTPVHEDPIDEQQEGPDSVSGHITLNRPGYTISFDLTADCYCIWTEGISGWIDDAVFYLSNITINGANANVTFSFSEYYSSYNTWGRADKKIVIANSSNEVYIVVTAFCDEYGDFSLGAHTLYI